MPGLNRRSLVNASLAGAAFAASSAGAQTAQTAAQPSLTRLPEPGHRSGATIEHNGARIFFQRFGQGSPMLLVHGYPLSGALFLRVVDILARNHTVITPDLRGYGQSQTPGIPDSVDTYADDMLALMDSLRIQKAIIGGMSMGGPTVLSMYRKAAERFGGLILIDTDAKSAMPQEAGLWTGLATLIEQKGVDAMIPYLLPQMLTGQTRMRDKSQLEYLTAIIKQCSKDAAIGGAKALANRPDASDLLARIDVPTLVLVGLDDPVYPYEISQMMQHKIRRSTLHLPGSEGQVTQDFVMANDPAFSAADPKGFLSNLKALAVTTDTPQGWKKAFSAVLRGAEAALESVGGKSATVTSLGGQPLTHILGETFYTQAPVLFGPYMAKLSLAPVSPGLTALSGTKLDVSGKPNVLRDAVTEFFRTQAGEWELRAQLCTDLETMPIEDASVPWPEEASPFVAVARITAKPQAAWSDARSAAVDDGLAFSPWHGLAAHRPIGGIMRARKPAYESSARFRATHNECPIHEPRALDSLPA